ncbi:DNA-binding protein [Nocardiopsis exhalans]|uniref:DNA-binding protein n=1 Tax=Nocardiopsis exhalans TaxID=163604 RepID=A0ABY5DIJ0_9ACTN|nr:DNA-binding protein [Nocardiopsis exhalans]USY23078.1 DNA-binding protein [Nocardiopsis exhalans]
MGPGEGGAEEVAALVRAVSAQIIDQDTRFGARDVVGTAVRAAARAHRIATARFGDSRDVLAAAAEAHQISGWVAFDSELQGLSRYMSVRALHLARAAGDRPMEYFVLSQLALQGVHLRQPVEAAQICESALTTARGSTATLFTLRAARAAAQTGEHRRARRLIRETRERHLDGPGPGDPAWTWWLTEAEISWHHGMVHADTGAWGRAAEHFADACRRTSQQGRSAAVYRASLLCALARARSWSEAENVLVHDVLPHRGAVASVRAQRMLDHAAHLLDAARKRPSLRESARQLRRHP